ncbi:MAG: glycoside hydrolase family 3 C-terminal domain-containing protein [Sphingomonadales bacterium]|nr:glycoside hydrolase family 3 C-terminal domain-containing protein [Sphingomonadales bacterium]
MLATMPAPAPAQPANLPWMSPAIIARQAAARGDAQREAVARQRARLLIAAMSEAQKLQQLTGSPPEILPELPQCFGARHVSGIAALAIPTFRITNGPVGVGQNDCISRKVYDEQVAGNPSPTAGYVAYTHPTSAQATALPSAMAVAASFDPAVADDYGQVIASEMKALGLHVFEAPGVNLARLPVLGRNFEYYGEDPFLAGTMASAEVRAVQGHGLIAMVKHFAANEQETNRQTIQASVDPQTLRELYLLPFEMAVRDGKAGAVMCAYNNLNGAFSCENRALLTGVLRKDWGFTGYVQSDFFAMKSTVPSLAAGLDHEMPLPNFWAPAKIGAALAKGEIVPAQIDTALERRFTQMFKAGVFDRPLVQAPIDFAGGAARARAIGTRAAVLLQNNGQLPLRPGLHRVMLFGKASQVYARQAVAGGSLPGKPMGSGGGSSDVVPHATVSPIDGLRAALPGAEVQLVLVDDANRSATIDGVDADFAAALKQAAAADAVIVMAGTISEEGADRATFANANGKEIAGSAAAGLSLDWYAEKPNVVATAGGPNNQVRDSGTTGMIRSLLAAAPGRTTLVLKDNAAVAVDPALLGAQGPAMLEVWFPGQEDGAIVADLLTGRANPSGHLPVTFPLAGKSFLDAASPAQFPGTPGPDGKGQVVRYSEGLAIGYRWYDANRSGQCSLHEGHNACVAFPFGHGLSYTRFALGKPRLAGRTVTVRLANTGQRAGAEVVQVYLALPAAAPGLPQPPKRLVAFRKLSLAPGRSGTVSITLDPAATNHPFAVWSENRHGWTIPAGRFTVLVGRSSAPADLDVAGTITLAGEDTAHRRGR